MSKVDVEFNLWIIDSSIWINQYNIICSIEEVNKKTHLSDGIKSKSSVLSEGFFKSIYISLE